MGRTEPANGHLGRRAFLGAAVATGALLAEGARAIAAAGVVAGDGAAVVRYPLYVPPTIDLATPFRLTAKPSTIDLGDGRPSRAWVYNGSMPGPTLRARPGDVAQITLINHLSQKTITHWHGLQVDDRNDGHPRYAIPPGGTYRYSFPVAQRAALNWYHPHPHMLTGRQVALGLPRGSHEVPLILRDARLDRAGNLVYTPGRSDFLGDVAVVNGTRNPYLDVDTALYRLRVLGAANARAFRLALSTDDPLTLIGNDGGLLPSAVEVAELDVSPSERVDLLVDFRGLPIGARVMLRDLRAGWDLLEFRVVRRLGVPARIPATLSTITPLGRPVRTRDFSFDGMTRINGLEYDMNRVDFQVPFGRTERWRFRTSGNAPHTVHVHGAPFQVTSRTGGRGRVFPWEAGWKDTVLLEDGETVEVLIRFSAYRGEYLIHCHKLEHEDMGMM